MIWPPKLPASCPRPHLPTRSHARSAPTATLPSCRAYAKHRVVLLLLFLLFLLLLQIVVA
ncbi:hypothetical protein BCR44DRAFT_1441220 [Catenaria anguillulae PL171]|uniref:Uncharacterized protein n=1 Tax=Catenaria anguillulae PL171 TaxID=765915 RepID=A0A1Y2HDE7_9FUNG|nr:hypothetical protein BCR44DRAFT_1441220 [Catenaria anguillulae PL171]